MTTPRGPWSFRPKRSREPQPEPEPAAEPEVVFVDVTGRDWMAVVGESFHRPGLLEAVGTDPWGERVEIVTWAWLAWEPENVYDPNAVAVRIGSAKVGHLSTKHAARCVALFQTPAPRVATCAAVIAGTDPKIGWGVRLRVDYSVLEMQRRGDEYVGLQLIQPALPLLRAAH